MRRLDRILTAPAVMALTITATVVLSVVARGPDSGIPAAVPSVALAGLLLAGILGFRERRRRDGAAARAAAVIRAAATGYSNGPMEFPRGYDVAADAIDELLQQIAGQRDTCKAEAQHLRRLQLALAHVRVGMMVVDGDGDVVFVNNALSDLLHGLHSAGDALSGVDIDQVVGKNVADFAGDIDLRRCNTAEVQLGAHWCRLSIDPIVGTDNSCEGAIIVWRERTQEHAFEAEMEALVSNAAQGDLSTRVDEGQQSGFSQRLARNVNALVSEAEDIIQDTVRVFAAMARGELSETIDNDYEGSFDRLKQDANSTVRRLREVVENIQQAAEAVNTAFREINQGNMNLSQRTEQQASSLEETASSMEEMTGTVQMNAENAREANELALKARAEAEKGGEVVGQAIEAMAEINASSGRIADIISVIDEIAFQTNLLALNASVEAARAGEQGRGFAVVAGEVRNLAGRSAEAAKDVKDLISDSVAKVRNGTTLVDESGKTLESIVARVNQVADIVAEISTASQEQATGISQVNETISKMDDMTQQNAALVEEVSAASELAGEQALRLQDMVSFFAAGNGTLAEPTGHQERAEPPPVRHPEPQPSTESRPTASHALAAGSDVDAEGDWEEF